MIIEIQNSKIKLDVPSFNCDYKLTKRDISPLINHHHFYTFIGIPKSGKTSLAVGLLSTKGKNKVYYKTFHNIILVCPTNSLNSL